MSITIAAFAEGLSGKLKSGDIVSVIAPDYLGSGETVIPAELKYVEVIAVTAKSGFDANLEDTGSEEEDKELPSTVTLLVRPDQSKLLARLEADGEIHLSLVYRGSTEKAKEFIQAQDDVLKELEETEQETDVSDKTMEASISKNELPATKEESDSGQTEAGTIEKSRESETWRMRKKIGWSRTGEFWLYGEALHRERPLYR